MTSVRTWDFVQVMEDNQKKLEFMLQEIDLFRDHADFVAIPCNTAHAVIKELRERLDMPVLAIHEEVCHRVRESGICKVGIMGTAKTVYSGFYQKFLQNMNIDCTTLDRHTTEKINNLIFDDMLRGVNHEELSFLIKSGIMDLKEQGCEGVVLGCTEFPLFVSQDEVEVKLFPSTQILAEAAIERIFSNVAHQGDQNMSS